MTEEIKHEIDPSLHRLLFFSDGVFAIAITLLSIELHVPHGWDGTLAGLWRSGWPMLSAFAVSFLVIGVFWNAHRRIFAQITRFSGGVFLFNLLLLGCVALMPFATSLIYSHGPHDQTLMIYLSLVAVTGLMQGLVYGYAAFVSDSLLPSVTRPQRIVTFLTMIILPVVVCSMALALTGGGSIVGFGVTIAMVAVLVAARRLLDKKLKAA